jgi:hypothetical protein
MIPWLFKRCQGGVFLVTLAALTSQPVRGGAYLPLVGPPPLRFEMAMVHAPKNSWMLPAPPPPVTVTETNPPTASVIPSNNIVPAPPPGTPTNAPAVLPPADSSAKSATPTRPAEDLLVVTPEMLVDYFKPTNAATNANSAHVPLPLNFTPPTSLPIPSSQAIYKNQ